MADARIEHLIHCSDDRFWTVFFDAEYNKALFLGELAFESWKLVSLDDKGDRIERVVDVVPRVGDLPGPLKKLAEGGAGYRERDVFDKKTKRMTLNVEPTVLHGKLTISGTMRTEPVGEGQCRRIYDTSVVAKVFGIGGLIENRIIQDVRASYDKAAVFTNKWVKEHP
jgi:hypothetical protein